MELSLSTQAVMQEIYAASALRCVLNGSDDRRSPLLTRDRGAALRMLVKDAFARVVMQLAQYVEASNLNGETATEAVQESADADDADVLLQMTLRVPSGGDGRLAGVLRHSVEHAVAMYAMHLCYMGHNTGLSEHHERLAVSSVNEILGILKCRVFTGGRLRPHWL